MLCLKCNERIPIISNLDFHSATISLYCQCDGENEIYNIRDYNTKLNEIKGTHKDINIKNQACFIHKDKDIELFCTDCFKELCYECDLKQHQKENHQLNKLDTFYDMINSNLNYFKNIKDLKFFDTFNIKYINDIIKFNETAFESFNSQKDKVKKNFSALKNICYLEMRLSEYDSKNIQNALNIKGSEDKKEKISKNIKYKYKVKINSIRKYLNSQHLNLNGDNISPSFLNALLIPNSNYCALISADSKLYIINIHYNNKVYEKKIEIEYKLDSKLNSSIYKLSQLNEDSFALLYTSGSFDLFFINKEKQNEKINLKRKAYSSLEKSTNIINQIQLSKEDNSIIVLIKDKINFYIYNETETITLVKQIDRNNITLMIYLNFHKAILTLFNTQEIIIKDVLEKKNYIIDIKERQINLILEIKSFNYLAITHFDSDIDIFDLNLMIMKNKLRGHRKIVNDIKELIPLPDSNYNTKLLSCSDDKTIRIWDLIKFYCEYIISFEKYSFLFSLNILPDKEIIALDNENIIHIID